LAEKKSDILDKVRFSRFVLVTAHRAENVDDPVVLRNFVEAFSEAPIPVVYPIHPRSRKRLRQQKILSRLSKSENVQLFPPLGYFDFLVLMKHCDMIITDSGGIQEEATAPPMRKPVIVIRLSTERPEAVEEGFARVVGVERHSILAMIERNLSERPELPKVSPYGDGAAAKKIVEILRREAVM